MKKLFTKKWRVFAIVAILVVLLLATIVMGAVFRNLPQAISQILAHYTKSGITEIIILMVLVVVTTWYAFSTRKALDIARNAEINAVLPIIKFRQFFAPHPERLRIACGNVGKGPALNLKVWVEYVIPEDPDNLVSSHRSVTVLGDGETGQWEWDIPSEGLVLPSSESRYKLLAEYNDIHGRKIKSHVHVHGYLDKAFGSTYADFAFEIEP